MSGRKEGRVRVYIATSMDGFIAGPGDDLSWLPDPPEGSGEDYGWGAFIADIGALLMGRGTYDAVQGMGVDWPFPDHDTLVATNRPLPDPPPRVEAVGGNIADLVTTARARAGGGDVYIDGGKLIRQALDAGLVDEVTVTLVPVVLGAGHPLFAGAAGRHRFSLVSHRPLPGGLVQLTWVPE